MIVFRIAGSDDADLLMRLERAASIAALAHVFGVDRAYPSDDVRARWELVLDGPRAAGQHPVTTLVALDGDEPVGFAAFDAVELGHFGVVPDRFGTGLADRMHAEVLSRCSDDLRLWVLEDNTRARRFYERHGWRPDGRRGESEFAPYPIQVGYRRTAAPGS